MNGDKLSLKFGGVGRQDHPSPTEATILPTLVGAKGPRKFQRSGRRPATTGGRGWGRCEAEGRKKLLSQICQGILNLTAHCVIKTDSEVTESIGSKVDKQAPAAGIGVQNIFHGGVCCVERAGHAPFEENADRRAESAFWREGLAFYVSLEGNGDKQASTARSARRCSVLRCRRASFLSWSENLNVKMQCVRHPLFRCRRKKNAMY